MTDNTNKPLDPKSRADELLNALRKGKGVYDLFSDSFRKSYLIAGRTLEAWEKQFKITIPSGLDPGQCKMMDIQLMELHQEASFYRATARAIMQALKKGSETEFRNRFTALVTEYQSKNEKLPAAATLDSLARTQIDDVDAAMMSANIANNFWEDIISHLAFCRKLIENTIMASGIELKAEQNGKYIDALNKKGNNHV